MSVYNTDCSRKADTDRQADRQTDSEITCPLSNLLRGPEAGMSFVAVMLYTDKRVLTAGP